jgi:hypothetical protein
MRYVTFPRSHLSSVRKRGKGMSCAPLACIYEISPLCGVPRSGLLVKMLFLVVLSSLTTDLIGQYFYFPQFAVVWRLGTRAE